jgi:hypothetical protein
VDGQILKETQMFIVVVTGNITPVFLLRVILLLAVVVMLVFPEM